MKPGDTVRFIDGDSAVVSQIKQILFDYEYGDRSLFIFESNAGSIVIRDRIATDRSLLTDGTRRPFWTTTWHICADEATAAHALDVSVPLHARALRLLNWFQKIAKEV